MRYFKLISDDEVYITAIGKGLNGNEVTETEYDEIMQVVKDMPHADGKGYRLRTDLTWEEYELPTPEPEEREITLDDALAKLRELGVDV